VLRDHQHNNIVHKVDHDVGHQQIGGIRTVTFRVVGIGAAKTTPPIAELHADLAIGQSTCKQAAKVSKSHKNELTKIVLKFVRLEAIKEKTTEFQ